MPQTRSIQTLADALAHLELVETELRVLRDQVNHQQRLASLGTIAAIIAHEFNNILTPMMAYAQMAAEAPGDIPLQHKAVKKAVESSDRASRIATAILSFARDQQSDSPFHVEPADECGRLLRTSLTETVESALLCLSRDPSKDGISLKVDIPTGACAAIDTTSLEQVLLNLVLNARKALAEHGGDLRIRASLHDSDQLAQAQMGTVEKPASPCPQQSQFVRHGPSGHCVFWHIEVEDSGCGMSSEQLGRLFQPFVTLDRASSGGVATQTAGTGLGLVVSRRLVEGAGGQLRVRSEVGKGTCFTIVLPAA